MSAKDRFSYKNVFLQYKISLQTIFSDDDVDWLTLGSVFWFGLDLMW